MPQQKKKSIRRKTPKEENVFLLYSKKHCDMRRKEAGKIDLGSEMKAASEKWKKMKDEQKIPWYQSHNQIKLLNKIEKDLGLLTRSNFDLIKSTFNTPFIIEFESLMAGATMEKRTSNNTDLLERLFEEIINEDMLS
ncbi:hypothetical protein RclHR1_01360012 [Rhizophagus clarus]|uniref:HMG box domain-containing protein n=1 Tax=Rhizophagus clarus TaxID=94130 RepID=A0A2Z6QQY6_9GLOM|nr:hypothetical protein RclHR1_01360012 [Rhizophagus clarus]GES83638.1 hypothetical protein GLOIN_2v1845153 [Rhizophagus clarus]